MKSRMVAIAVPVRPFPELQWTTITLRLSSMMVILIITLTFDPVIGAFGYFEKVGERRAVMVGPVILSHTPTKVLVFVVRRPL